MPTQPRSPSGNAAAWATPSPLFGYFAFSGGESTVVTEGLRSAFSGCRMMPRASFMLLVDTEAAYHQATAALPLVCPQHYHHRENPMRACTSEGMGYGAAGDGEKRGGVCAHLAKRSAVWGVWTKSGFNRSYHQSGLGGYAKIVASADGVLPAWTEQLVVLDTDTFFNQDYSSTWYETAKTLQSHPGALLSAKQFNLHNNLGQCFKGHHVNSGVMHMDLKRMREARWAESVVSVAADLRGKPTCFQDIGQSWTNGFVNEDVICSGDQEILSLACGRHADRCLLTLEGRHNNEMCAAPNKRLPHGQVIYHYNCWPSETEIICPEEHCRQMVQQWSALRQKNGWALGRYSDHTVKVGSTSEHDAQTRALIKEKYCNHAWGGGRRRELQQAWLDEVTG